MPAKNNKNYTILKNIIVLGQYLKFSVKLAHVLCTGFTSKSVYFTLDM